MYIYNIQVYIYIYIHIYIYILYISSVSSIKIVPDDVAARAARALEHAESQAAVPWHLLVAGVVGYS